MEEIIKHINDTNASYRQPNAGDAKNTDLFLDNEHYSLFKDSGDQITVRYDKENLTKAILFIASILPRKFDQSATHELVKFSKEFVLNQLAIIEALFTEDGKSVNTFTQVWTARKDVPQKNGKIDKRFYFNGLLKDVLYTDCKGVLCKTKFTIRNYFAGGYSDLHIIKEDDGIFDVRVTNANVPTYDNKEDGLEETDSKVILNLSSQQIFYGAPGTGKSHAVKAVSDQYPDTIRTTFHPDSDYASFVGAYKPTVAMEKLYDEAGVPVKVGGQELSKNQITYKFVKQAFLKAYVKAWKKFQKAEDASHVDSQFLVIEEINRGNCAQIFGDLFQLLDRKNGFSEYPIEADEDIAKSLLDEDTPENPSFGKVGLQLAGWQKTYIENLFQKSKDKDVIVEKISKGKVLVLPRNLYIWATMNTSDQSLFPIDSAFKRRWDWKYVPINTKVKKWAIEVEGQKYSWTSFLDNMNEQIFKVTHSEDKKFGFFFCHADKKSDDTVEEEDVISAEKFVSKVIFFIYNDVFKDYGFDRKIFEGEDGKSIQFHEYYHMDGSVDESKVKKFLENVKVKPFEAEQAEEAQE